MKRFGTFSMLCFLLVACFAVQSAHAQLVVKAKRSVVGSVAKGSGATSQKYYNPTGEYYVSGGMKVVAKGMRAYYQAVKFDTGSTQMSTYAWTLSSKPAGSTAAITNATAKDMYFNPDVVGQYIVGLSVNGSATSADTIWVSTYAGHSAEVPGCFCHNQNQTDWAKTAHATIFKRGVTGNLENNATYGGKGAYAQSCIKCHTTGWESKTDNGNFGILANKSTFDSTWWKGLSLADGDYWIPKDDMTIWNNATIMTAPMKQVASIGCESCHGPAAEHKVNSANRKGTISKSLSAGTCNQCHNALPDGTTAGKHNLGSYWLASAHAKMENSTAPLGHATSASCAKCHSGQGFVKSKLSATDAAKWPTDDYANDAQQITCAVCHDAHSDANPNQLRTVKVDSLMTGFVPTTGGKGQLCMNCHQERKNVATAVKATTAPYYGYSDRFGAHHSPQADVFYGKNGFEYGKASLQNISTHGMVADACVTCHMPTITWGSSIHSSHAMTMDSASVRGCQTCHSGSTSFDGIKTRNTDYDGNGKVEGVQTEVMGLLARIKAKLPIDAATGEPVNMMKDSLLVKNKPEVIKAIWNYYLVKNDGSHGVHNPQYVISLLKETINNLTGTGVEATDVNVPKVFELSQNYPNPFNPTTDIRFSIPATSVVKLQVYNSIGQLVATLVDGTMAAGNYSAKLNGSSFSSGIYLYRLEASSNGKTAFVTTKKMLLVK